MGSLGGHVLPGVFFLVYGLWWIFTSIWLYLTTSLKLNSRETGKYSDADIKSKSYIPQPFCTKVPIESIIKTILPLIGIICEMFIKDKEGHIVTYKFSLYNSDGSFAKLVVLQHATMYSCFALSGIIDLISLCIQYPKHTSQLFTSLALVMEALLFYFHLGGRDPLDQRLHQLLVIAIVIGAVSAAMRMLYATNLFVNCTLALSYVLQGTWFIQIGVVLYGGSKIWEPLGDEEREHRITMFIIACFIWHVMIIGVGMFIFYTFTMIGLKYIKTRREEKKGGVWGCPLTIDSPGYQPLLNDEEVSLQNYDETSI